MISSCVFYNFFNLSHQNLDTNLRKRVNNSSYQASSSQQRAQSTTNISGLAKVRCSQPLASGANDSSSSLIHPSPKSLRFFSMASSSAQLLQNIPQAASSTPDMTGRKIQNQTANTSSLPHLLGPKLEHVQMMGNKLELKQTPCSEPTVARIDGTSKIDKYARIFFPVSFGAFTIVYWVIYLSRDTIEAKGD